MQIDFRNPNTLWASILVETLKRLGLIAAVICPGSRCAPLAVAFASNSDVESIVVLDERSASFLALGMAKRTGLPVALVCTSGTAGANFYPATIEARESKVPLLILTADRPLELRQCRSGQTIDQVKLYGNYPNWQAELALPEASMAMLRYLRQTLIQAWERSLFPFPGPVHLNLPFRDPLVPISSPDTEAIESQFQFEEFFSQVFSGINSHSTFSARSYLPLAQWQKCEKGVIIAGVAHSLHPQKYCRAIALLSRFLGWPVLAEALSPVRNHADFNPNLISTYDFILRDRQLALELAPVMAIQIGELPTSKELRSWLHHCQPQRWIVDPGSENSDALHGRTIHLHLSIEQLSATIHLAEDITSNYLNLWRGAETRIREAIDLSMAGMDELFEGKVAWLVSQILPPETPVFIANSMSVRYAEFFWVPSDSRIVPYFNRGANGIDGTLSTALGVAYRHQSSVMITGDLALLHDTNGFLLGNKFVGHLTIILIDNNGGGIFETLSISQFNPPFEEFFATPQHIPFDRLCATYGVEHRSICNWKQLQQLLNPLPERGIRVLELQTDRKADARWLREYPGKFL